MKQTVDQLIKSYRRNDGSGRHTILSANINSELDRSYTYIDCGLTSGLESNRKGSCMRRLLDEARTEHGDGEYIWIYGARLQHATQGRQRLLVKKEERK